MFSKEILRFVFGSDYVLASPMLVIISIGFFINYIMINVTDTLRLLKKTKLIFYNSIIIAFLNVFLNYLLIPVYGGIGAAIATSFSFVIMTILVFAESMYFLRIIPFNKKWINVFLAGIFSSLIFAYLKYAFFKDMGFISFILLVVMFGLVYIILLYALRAFQKEDISILKDFKGKLNKIFIRD